MRRSASAVVLGTALLMSAFAASAQAKIEPQVGIAGIELGMTPAEVIAEKGEPDAERVVPMEILGEVRKMRYGKTKAFFLGTAATDTVFSVRTTSRGQRTDGGAGVGSKEERVAETVPDVRCVTEAGFRYCFVGRRRPGKVVTSFFFSRRTDQVARIFVGIVID
jgi:hypothetical protein